MEFKKFAQLIIEHNVLPPKGFTSLKQPEDGIIMEVKKDNEFKYKPLYCWYNCKAHTMKFGGRVVFGWALFYESDMYQAQHHAIWCSPEGEYIDVTPDTDESIVVINFLPDGRVPFDYEQYRRPANFFALKEPNSKTMWGVEVMNKYDPKIFYVKSEPDEEVKSLLGIG